MKKGRITTSDIAVHAGVSQSAVSLILNSPDENRFSSETVHKVLSAAEDLGYKHKPRVSKTPYYILPKTILIVCPVISNPYYSSLAQAIEQEAVKYDFSTITCNTYRSIQREQKIINSFIDSNISGIIFTFVPQSLKLIEEINIKVPVVVIGDRNTSVNTDTVEIDSILSGNLIAEHLISLGHRNVAFISTTLSEHNSVRVNRLVGLNQTFEKHNIQNAITIYSETVTSDEDLYNPMIELNVGSRLAQKAMQDKKNTALIAVNDMVAYGVINAVQQAGYSIPKDYSVCGFDNIYPSDFPAIALTTVDHYIMEKGRNAVDILFERTQCDNTHPINIKRLEYHPHLIVRKSTAKARS